MPPRNVHIASGNGGGGAGTGARPFLAETAERFDEILGGVPEDAHIHLGPGVFFTRGLRHEAGAREFGWQVRSGWRITGAGAGRTILQLEDWPHFLRSRVPRERRRAVVIGSA